MKQQVQNRKTHNFYYVIALIVILLLNLLYFSETSRAKSNS